MTRTEQALRKVASKLPGTELGVACKGTAVESTTFGVGGKSFLFLAVRDGAFLLRLKLKESRPEATKLAAKEPGRYSIGAGGWAKIVFGVDEPAPLETLQQWIGESYGLVAAPAVKAAKAAKRKSSG